MAKGGESIRQWGALRTFAHQPLILLKYIWCGSVGLAITNSQVHRCVHFHVLTLAWCICTSLHYVSSTFFPNSSSSVFKQNHAVLSALHCTLLHCILLNDKAYRWQTINPFMCVLLSILMILRFFGEVGLF